MAPSEASFYYQSARQQAFMKCPGVASTVLASSEFKKKKKEREAYLINTTVSLFFSGSLGQLHTHTTAYISVCSSNYYRIPHDYKKVNVF